MGVIKINGVTYGGTPIDDELNINSENPVQNKVVTTALNTKANTSDMTTALAGKVDLNNNYIELGNEKRLYISDTTHTGTIPEGSIGVGF